MLRFYSTTRIIERLLTTTARCVIHQTSGLCWNYHFRLYSLTINERYVDRSLLYLVLNNGNLLICIYDGFCSKDDTLNIKIRETRPWLLLFRSNPVHRTPHTWVTNQMKCSILIHSPANTSTDVVWLLCRNVADILSNKRERMETKNINKHVYTLDPRWTKRVNELRRVYWCI